MKRHPPHNVLIGRQSLVDLVCVVDNVPGEEQRPEEGVDKVHGPPEWYEHADESSHDERDEAAEEPGPHAREVVLLIRFRLALHNTGKDRRTLTFDWKVNSVKPRNTPMVISSACITILLS